MATSRNGPNPLRPYYIPPSIGFPPEAPSASSAPRSAGNGTSTSYASSARDIFGDIDYSDYVSDDNKSMLDMIRQILDEAMYKYLAVLLAQPFDVAKTILQVRSQGMLLNGDAPTATKKNTKGGASGFMESRYEDFPSDDSDPDEPAYFTSSTPAPHSPGRSEKHVTDRAGYVLPDPSDAPGPHQLALKRSDSLLEVIGALWTKEGVWGVWKGTNATFIYSALLRTFENWARSFLSAVLNAPDPGLVGGLAAGLDVIDSPYPWSSLGIAIGAAAIAGVALVPLDIVRTRLMVTSTNAPRKGLLGELKQLPSWICPSQLFIPTLLHSITSPAILHSTPLILRSQVAIDPIQSPNIFSVMTFCSQAVELFVKLPLETVLRRGQLAVLASEPYHTGRELHTVVDIGPYSGPIGTMWQIVREEGERKEAEFGAPAAGGNRKIHRQLAKPGQGVEGLWRGWRIGMWGLVGMWGAAAMGGIGGNGGEF